MSINTTTWRTAPYSARGRIHIHEPAVAMAALVAESSVQYPVAEINFDTVSSGAYTDVMPGMTVLFGSSAGKWDYGIGVVRKAATSGTLYIGWSSQGRRRGLVDVVDNSYITVLHLYEVWAKRSRLADDGTMYINYEETPDDLPPVAVIGSATGGGVGEIGEVSGGVLTVELDASGSYATAAGATIDSYQWTVPSGVSITVGTDSDDEITVECDPGDYWITLEVTDTNGNTGTRHYLIAALDDSAVAAMPAVRRVSARMRAEGQRIEFDLKEALDIDDVPPGTVVLYGQREKYGSTVTNLTGIATKFAGWLDSETMATEAARTGNNRTARLVGIDAAGRLAQMKALPWTMAHEAARTTHNELPGLTVPRFAHFYLHSFSTALEVADFDYGAALDTSHPAMRLQSPGGTLYDTVDGIYKSVGWRLTCDSRGRLLARKYPLQHDSGDRTSDVQVDITEADVSEVDYVTTPRGNVQRIKTQATVISSAYASVLVSPFPDIYALAPGYADAPGDQEQQIDIKWHVTGLAELLERTSHAFGALTSRYSVVRLRMRSGGDAGIEPAEMKWVTLTLTSATKGFRDDAWSAVRCLPLEVSYTVDDETGTVERQVTVMRETFGYGSAVDTRPNASDQQIPVSPPVDTIVPPNDPLGRGQVKIAMLNSDKKVYRTTNFTKTDASGGPKWTAAATLATTYAPDNAVIDPYCAYMQKTGTRTDVVAVTWEAGSGADMVRVENTESTPSLGTEYALTPVPTGHIAIEACRAAEGVYYAAWNVHDDSIYVAVTTDGATSAPDIYQVPTGTAKYDTDDDIDLTPGLWVDPRDGTHAIVTAYKTTGSGSGGTAVVAAYETTNSGVTWTECTDPNILPGSYIGSGLTVPFQDVSGSIALFSYKSGSGDRALKRVFGSNSPVDITPTASGAGYAPFEQRGVAIDESDWNYGVVIGSNACGAVGGTAGGSPPTSWTRGFTFTIANGEMGWTIEQGTLTDDGVQAVNYPDTPSHPHRAAISLALYIPSGSTLTRVEFVGCYGTAASRYMGLSGFGTSNGSPTPTAFPTNCSGALGIDLSVTAQAGTILVYMHQGAANDAWIESVVLSGTGNDPFDCAGEQFGVFDTFNLLATTPNWRTAVQPSTVMAYRRAYVGGVGERVGYLIGNSGAVGMLLDGKHDDKSGNLSTSGRNVALWGVP